MWPEVPSTISELFESLNAVKGKPSEASVTEAAPAKIWKIKKYSNIWYSKPYLRCLAFRDLMWPCQILPYGKRLVYVDPNRPENNIYHLSNFVFIRKDLSENFKWKNLKIL